MKKMLALLFVLGSVSVLAAEAEYKPGGGGASDCYDKPCEGVSKDFEVKFKVPEQLKLTAQPVDLGLWCNDKTLTKKIDSHHTITGEVGKRVNVTVGKLEFTLDNNQKHEGTITHNQNGVLVLDNNGTKTGGITVTVPKVPSSKKLTPGNTYKAMATLTAAYDLTDF